MSKSKFSNYDVADPYRILIAAERTRSPFLEEVLAVGCSNKLTAQELCQLNGTTNLSLIDANIWYTSLDLSIIIASVSKSNIQTWRDLLQDPIHQQDKVSTTNILFSKMEATGGDVFFVVDSSEVYPYEVKAGGTAHTGIPFNSHISAFQAKYGEVPHILSDGLIVLDNTISPQLSKEEKTAIMFADTITRLFGTMENMQQLLQSGHNKISKLKEDNNLHQIPVWYLNTVTNEQIKYVVTEFEIAPRSAVRGTKII